MKYSAHIRESDHAEQSVAAHCNETAALAAAYGKSVHLEQVCLLSGLLHDIGKLTADFDGYLHGRNDIERGRLDHSFAGAKYLAELAPHEKYAQKTAELIGRVILSHHGLHDWVNQDSEDNYEQRISKTKYYDEIMQNLPETHLTKDIERILTDAAAEYSAIDQILRRITPESAAETYAFYLGMLERLLQSILIDADRTNTADFMSNSKTEADNNTLELWKKMKHKMQEKLASFNGQNDSISIQRKSISDRCAAFAAHDVRICRLIVPTGGGKTLSSLRFAIEYANLHPVDRIIYVAPFMSILEQNSEVIREITGEEGLLEHHSNMLAEISGNDDLLHEYELRTEKWDAPVIATTMVQFLNALFSGKSSAVRRMHQLSRAVIIVDEVQSVPLKCVCLFNLAMNFLSRICGSTIVLCSATQPPFEQTNDFPLLLDEQSSITGDTAEDFSIFQRTRLIHLKQRGGYSYDEAAAFCREQFAANGSLLTVVNTKAAAKELYQRLKDTAGASVFHLSTAMCPLHRRKQIEMIKALLCDQKPVICVTTQLIEAGVDISFGCVVRSMAGLDNAAQAAGRCNRNGEFHRICPVYLLELREEKLGSLAEIKYAQQIAEELLDVSESADFLGIQMQSQYFGKLFAQAQKRDFKNTLRYPLPDDTDKDLVNLLSLNCNRVKKNTHPKRRFSGQAFKTAGAFFSVIDSKTVSVIVPFDAKAEQYIAELSSNPNPKEAVRLLRQLQQYAVSIYAGTERELNKEGALYDLPCGESVVRILEKRFYDEQFGVTVTGGLHEVLCL